MKHILPVVLSILISGSAFGGVINGEDSFNFGNKQRTISSEENEKPKAEEAKSEAEEKETRTIKRRPFHHRGMLQGD